jgi:DNA polymerase-3 subunit delta
MFYAGALKKEMKESTKGLNAICLDIRENDLPVWIKEKIRQKGIAIKDDALGYLIGVVGDDIGLLSSEVEKLASFGNETITISGIKEIVEGSRDYSVFDLTNALREKNVEKVFRIYRTLSGTTEPYNLLGAINWQYSKMSLQANAILQRKNFSRAFELLNDADIQIKTSGGTYPMEHLLVRLMQL